MLNIKLNHHTCNKGGKHFHSGHCSHKSEMILEIKTPTGSIPEASEHLLSESQTQKAGEIISRWLPLAVAQAVRRNVIAGTAVSVVSAI